MIDRPTLFDPSPLTRHRRPDRPVVHDVGMARPAIPTTDPTTLARHDDPETSKAGARSVTYRSGSQKARLLAVYAAADRPITDAEAADQAGLLTRPGCCWWHRCSDLRHDGLIVQVGTGISPITGETAMLSTITPVGRTVAVEIRTT